MLGAGVAALVWAGPAAAGPLDELSGALSNGSSELNLDQLNLDSLLPTIKDLIPGTTGTQTGKTRCTSVIQVGDSTSVNADKAASLPAATDSASEQFKRVGVTTTTVDAYSGRAVVGGPGTDAEQTVKNRLAAGEKGCWVIAMGINDAGSVSSGGSVSADERIDRIMRQLAGQPVLWPAVTSSNPSNQAFGKAAMTTFNEALRKATTRYSNLAVYDWAGAATAGEFAGDGIHYTAAGTADRNRRFADALAKAYPTGVGSTPAVRWVTG